MTVCFSEVKNFVYGKDS